MTLIDDINEMQNALQGVPVRDGSSITYTPKAPTEFYSPLLEQAARAENIGYTPEGGTDKLPKGWKCPNRTVIPWLPSSFHWGKALKIIDDIDIFTAMDTQAHYTSKEHRKDPIPFAELPFLILSETATPRINKIKLLNKGVEYNRRCEHPLNATSLNNLVNEVYTMYLIYGAAQKREQEQRAKARAQERENTGEHKYPDSLYTMTEDTDNEGEFYAIDINHPEVCAYIKKKLIPVSFNDTLYIYSDGIYRENAHDVDAIVVDILHDRNIKRGEGKTCADIIHALKGMEPKFTDYPFNPVGTYLVVENGVIDIEGGSISLGEHHSSYMATYKLPVEYNEKASPAPFRECVNQWVEEKDRPILSQIFAQSLLQLMQRTTYKRSYILQGLPHSGKSSYEDLGVKLFGLLNISRTPLQQFCGEHRFVAASLEGKIINLKDDLSDISLDSGGAFKDLTGTVTHQIERKGKDIYTGIITAPHCYSCNIPPSYDEKLNYDDAFFERFEFVSFPNHFKVDPDFQARTYTPEFMSGVLNAILEEMIKIYKNNALTINHSADEVRERWGMLSDPVKMWLHDSWVEDIQIHDYDKKKLWAEYQDYEANDAKIPKPKRITEGMFYRKMSAEGFSSIQIDFGKRGQRDRKWFYRTHMRLLLTAQEPAEETKREENPAAPESPQKHVS